MKQINTSAGLIGSALEWYDFLLYIYFASILAPLFFPAHSYFVSLLMAFLVFAIGFLARPIGALVIGHIGDTYGRRRALILSMSIMTISTFLIGVLPIYETIGIAAPLLLTIIRCVQGFAVSGEIGTSTSYLVEHAAEKKRGFAGSLVMTTAYLGIFIGLIVVTLVTYFIPQDILSSWGWRIPFILTLPWGILALILRLRSMESPQFINQSKEMMKHHQPIKTIFLNHKRLLLFAIGVVSISATCDYFFIGFFTHFLTNSNSGITLESAMLINMISIFVFLFLVPFFGFLSDRVGRKKIYCASLLGIIILGYPVFWLLIQKTFLTALAGEILFAFLLAGIDGIILTFLAEIFPTHIRNTGLTLTYNVSLAIFGGTVPFLAVWLIHTTQLEFAPFFILS